MSLGPDYKVVILAAGRGSHLGPLTDGINKALLPVGFRAVISYIIEKFPAEVELVVALGHEKEKLKEYLAVAHGDRNFSFVDIDNLDGPGSGPGYSLLRCKEYLQCPFIFSTVDTIVVEGVPAPTENWLGVAPVKDTTRFNSVKLRDGLVVDMKDKVKSDNTHAFIGLCGVRDYDVFWRVLQQDTGLVEGERQVGSGLKALLEHKLCGVEFTWFDTGDTAGYKRACQHFAKGRRNFDFSKSDEYLYFVGDRVIKYFSDQSIVGKRVKRAEYLAGAVPRVDKTTSHFFSYTKISGRTMYETLTAEKMDSLLRWLENHLWQPVTLGAAEQQTFNDACWRFYHDKTRERAAKYFAVTGECDDFSIVNGASVLPLGELLDRVDWRGLCRGTPSLFHGDLQFDNVLVTENERQPFVLLDWRQDFGGLLEYGDRYYDLAKLNGGLIIPYSLIKENGFSFERQGRRVTLDIASRYLLVESAGLYRQFLTNRQYDVSRVDLLTALIFLNMSPLHTEPFNFLLHHLGKLRLARALEKETVPSL